VSALAGQADALGWGREFRKLLAASAVAHLLLAVVLAVRIQPELDLEPTPVMVDLIAPAQAPAAPTEKAAPAAPAQPKPLPEKVVMLPKEKPPLPKPQPQPAQPTPEPKPQAKPVPAPPRPEPAAPTKTAEEILADLRSRVDSRGDEASSVIAAIRAKQGGRFDPEGAAYHKKVRALLQSNWVGVGAFANDPALEARFSVRVDAAGGILSVDLVHSSGNTFYDDSAERAIRKSAPLPPPPRGAMELDVRFRPGGVA
jgi:TonB family protein